MKAKFKLQTLLIIKKRQQEQALMRYAHTVQQVLSIEKKYQQLCQQRQQCENLMTQSQIFSSQHHLLQIQQLSHLNEVIKSVQQHINVMKEEEDKRLKLFLHAKKETKIFYFFYEKAVKEMQAAVFAIEDKERNDWTQSTFRKVTA